MLSNWAPVGEEARASLGIAFACENVRLPSTTAASAGGCILPYLCCLFRVHPPLFSTSHVLGCVGDSATAIEVCTVLGLTLAFRCASAIKLTRVSRTHTQTVRHRSVTRMRSRYLRSIATPETGVGGCMARSAISHAASDLPSLVHDSRKLSPPQLQLDLTCLHLYST